MGMHIMEFKVVRPVLSYQRILDNEFIEISEITSKDPFT